MQRRTKAAPSATSISFLCPSELLFWSNYPHTHDTRGRPHQTDDCSCTRGGDHSSVSAKNAQKYVFPTTKISAEHSHHIFSQSGKCQCAVMTDRTSLAGVWVGREDIKLIQYNLNVVSQWFYVRTVSYMMGGTINKIKPPSDSILNRICCTSR